MSIQKYNKMFKIGVVSLSLPVYDYKKPDNKSRELKIQAGIEYLTRNGFEVLIGKSTFNRPSLGYKAASIKDRRDDLHQMFLSNKVNVIMNTIGGYCANEILESLDYDMIEKNPKVFVGFSDITAINLALFTKSKIRTVNGMHLGNHLDNQNAFFSLFSLLNNEVSELHSSKYIWENDIANTLRQPGEIECLKGKKTSSDGWLIGGNLSTFCLMLGTEYVPDFSGSILLLEYDKEEANCLPSLERLMWQIRQNGIFKRINGLVFGQLQNEVMAQETDYDKIERILRDVTEGYDFPVLFNAPFGHFYPTWQVVNGSKISILTTGNIKINIKN